MTMHWVEMEPEQFINFGLATSITRDEKFPLLTVISFGAVCLVVDVSLPDVFNKINARSDHDLSVL